MFEFKGTESIEGSRPEGRIMDHMNVQDTGRRPFTPMRSPAHHQRRNTEGAGRPSLPLRSRSNSYAPNYSRSQDRDDFSSAALAADIRRPRLFVDRRHSGGSTQTRDGLENFTPKAWMAKGSRLLKRQHSKHELTSLRPLDWVEEDEEPRVQRPARSPPSNLRHRRMQSSADRKFLWSIYTK